MGGEALRVGPGIQRRLRDVVASSARLECELNHHAARVVLQKDLPPEGGSDVGNQSGRNTVTEKYRKKYRETSWLLARSSSRSQRAHRYSQWENAVLVQG